MSPLTFRPDGVMRRGRAGIGSASERGGAAFDACRVDVALELEKGDCSEGRPSPRVSDVKMVGRPARTDPSQVGPQSVDEQREELRRRTR